MSNRNRKRSNKNKQTKPVVQVLEGDKGENDPEILEGFRYIEPNPQHTEASESEPDEAFEAEPKDEAFEAEPEPEDEAFEAEPEPEDEVAQEEEPENAEIEPEEIAEEVPETEDEDPIDELPPRRKPKPKKKPVKEVEIIRVEPEAKEKPKARHGNKFNILFVSESTKRVKTIRTTADKILLLTLLFAGLIAAIVAYIVHQSTVREEYEEKIESLNEEISTLSEDKILLQADIEALDQELQDANGKLSKKENQAQAQNEEQALLYMPSALPLDSQALPSEYDKDNKWITLDAAPGVHIVATGAGKVEYSGESIEAGGYLVSVNHGNGYVSNYYCQSQPAVKEGNEVNRGTTLYVIGDEADKLIYRIQYEDDYIDPYTVLNIAG